MSVNQGRVSCVLPVVKQIVSFKRQVYCKFTSIWHKHVMGNAFRRKISSLSTGATAFVCAGVLMHAILTQNGGDPNSQSRWQDVARHKVGIMDEIDARIASNRKQKNLLLDRIMVGGVKADPDRTDQDDPAVVETKQSDKSIGVLDLIRENSDIAPPVSSGTNRISVTIREGDTLYSIARRHGLDVQQLAALNGLEEPYIIKIGQTLFVAR